MAFRTRRGTLISVPSSTFSVAEIGLWLLELIALPFILASPLYMLTQASILSSPVLVEWTSYLYWFGIIFFDIYLIGLLPGFMVLIVQINGEPPLSVPAQLGVVFRSRLFAWTAIWVFLNVITNLAFTRLASGLIRDIVIISAPVLSLVAFIGVVRTLRKIAKESRQQPIYAGLSPTTLSKQVSFFENLGPGDDFPKSPQSVTTPIEAAKYVQLARQRQLLRHYAGLLIVVVASAFIGTAGVWVFSGEPGPRILVFFLPISIALFGYMIQLRAGFYANLSTEYQKREQQLIRQESRPTKRKNPTRSADTGTQLAD